jgi:hypothetical protein
MASTPTRPSTALSNTFIPLTLGCSANAIKLLVPVAPLVTAPSDLKARCYDYLSDSLLEYAPVYSSAKLIAAFSHIPGSTHNATLEASTIANSIKSSFFAVGNLTGLGFRDATGTIISDVTLDPSSRPAGILYFAFRSRVDPKTTNKKLTLATLNVDICLALPQSTLPATTQNNLLSKFNSASTPAATDPPPVTTPIITLDNLEDLPATNIAFLGVNDGTDTIAD